nr:hypothetical protein [Tanacetum cinerariifolium]
FLSRTMDMTIGQQVALDEALVPHASRLRIGKSNLRLRLDITSKESTLQVVYDVLRLTPFYKAFLVTPDVPEIYMQEFWAIATVHHHSIRFKMNNKKRIINLEYFREMLHICPRIPNQTFDELPFEEETIAFLRYLRHSEEIKKITDDFVYQVEHKDAKNSNEMYYLRFTKLGAILHVEQTNEDIRNSAAYNEYYAIALGAAPPKTKASVRKTHSSSDTTMSPPTAAGTRISTSAKGKQPAKSSKAKGLFVLSEVALIEAGQIKLAIKRSLQQTHISQASGSGVDKGTSIITGVPDVPSYESDEEISWKSSGEDDDDVDDQSNDDASHGRNVGGDEGSDAEDDDNEFYGDVNINLEGRDVQMTDVHTTQELEDTHVTLTLVNPDGIDSLFESTHRVDVPFMTTVEPPLLSAQTPHPPSIPIISQVQQAPAPSPTTAPSTSLCKLAVQIQSDRLRDEAQAKNEYFLNKLDENIQKIIKEQVKEQVKTSYVVAADLSELELKKILIEKMESNKSIHRSNEQRNLYKALVDAYACDKIILDTYGDTITLKIRCDDEDKDEEPSTGSDRGSKRRRACKEAESTSASKEKESKTSGKSTEGSKSHQNTANYGHIKWIEDLVPRTMWSQTPVSYDKYAIWESSHWGRKRQQFYGFVVNRESDRDVYSKCRIIAVTELQIVKWHNYKHLDWITVRRDDDKLYKFKEGVESYQKKLNLTNPDTYRSDLKRKEAFTTYSNPRGFIYQNKDKQNRLMHIDELHKFSDGMLNDVQTALDDHLKGIRMKYLPQTIWRRSDKERAAAMIQAIDKQLKTMRIMQSLEKFDVHEKHCHPTTYGRSSIRVEETMNLRYLEEKPNIQGLGHEWYFDLDYLTDTLGYKHDKAKQSAGTQEATTNPAGTQDVDSDSDCDEQVIIVPSYPSHIIPGTEPKDTSGDEVDDSPLSSADELFQKELARLKGQEQSATSDAERLGLGFANDAEKLQKRASAKTVPSGSIPVPTGSIPVPCGDTMVSTDDVPVHTSSPTDSFFDDEPTTRFPSPSNLGNHDPSPGIFSSSSYDDEFGTALTNAASTVDVSPVATKRINTIHP